MAGNTTRTLPSRGSRLSVLLATALGFGLALGQAAEAADLVTSKEAVPETPAASLPAVDGLNGSLSLFGGNGESGGVYAAAGSIALPLAYAFGSQTDGMVANLDGSLFLSLGEHLFWRQPSTGLVGLYAAYERYEAGSGIDAGKVGLEGEAYLGRFTVRGTAGVEFGESGAKASGATVTTFDLKTRFFDAVDLVYYPTDNLSLYAGHRFTGGDHALAIGGEYLIASTGSTAFSSFVEGQVGEDDAAVYGGLKLRFGNSAKTLIRRDREDDPRNWQPDTAVGIMASQAVKPVHDE